MIHPSSSEDEADGDNPIKEEQPVSATTSFVRKNSIRSQAKSDSSASFPESSHSSLRVPSPSPSVTSDEVDVRSRQHEESDHFQRLQLYVFVVRCIAYPCTTTQPTDLPVRPIKVKKEHLTEMRSNCAKCLAEKQSSTSDEVFCEALSSFCKKILNTPQLDSLVLAGGCALSDLKEMFRPYLISHPYLKVLERKDITRTAKEKPTTVRLLFNNKRNRVKIPHLGAIDRGGSDFEDQKVPFFLLAEFVVSSLSRFDALLRGSDDDTLRLDAATSSANEAISTKEELYDLYQNILGMKKFEHQMVFSTCQLDNTDEQAAALRRELRGRIKAADKIEIQERFPEFYFRPGQSEMKVRQQYLNELRLQVNDVMSALEAVPLSSKTNNGKFSGNPQQKLRKLQLPSLPSSDHSAEEEAPLSKSDVILQFAYEVIVVEVQGLKSVSPNRLVYCTMEVGGSREKLQTDLVPVSKPVWDSQGDFTSTHPLCVIKVKLFVKNKGMLAIEDKELGRANLLWYPGLNNSKSPQWYDMIVPKNTPDQLRLKLSVYMERPLNMKQFGHLWAQGSTQWKVWKKRFFMLVQVSQCNFALCSYVERRTEPVAMLSINGYAVDYSAPDKHKNTQKIYFKLVKNKNAITFASEDYQDGVQWVQAIYRATGQNHRPTPPPLNAGRDVEKRSEYDDLDSENTRQQDVDAVVAADPCKYDHASLFELLQRRSLHYRLNDITMNMGNFTPGQTLILGEYCTRYGVRDLHRRLSLLSDMLDQADRGLIVDAQILRYNYLLCNSHVTARISKKGNNRMITKAPRDLPTITVDEMERYRTISKRVENYLIRQITCFWYCFPFGRPKGNLKSTLEFLNLFKEDTVDNNNKKNGGNPESDGKLAKARSEDSEKPDEHPKLEDRQQSHSRQDSQPKPDADKEKEETCEEKSEMRLAVSRCFIEGAHIYHKKMIETYNVPDSDVTDDCSIPVNELVKSFLKLSEDAGESLYNLPRNYAGNFNWFSAELFTYSETFLSLLNKDVEKFLKQKPTDSKLLFRIFTNLAKIFKTHSLWKTSAVKIYLSNMFTPVLVSFFDTTEASIKKEIAIEQTKKGWKSAELQATTKATLSILNKLESVITFISDLEWIDLVYIISVEDGFKTIAANFIETTLASAVQRFINQKNSLRSNFDLVTSPAVIDLINYAIMTKESIVKLCGAGRDFTGKVKFYHQNLEKSVDETLKSMAFGIADKYDQVFKECVLDKLARYDEGSLTAGFMRIANPTGYDMVTGYMSMVTRNQDALMDGIHDYTLAIDVMQLWYQKVLERLLSWLEARSKLHVYQLKASIVFFKKFTNEFATQGLGIDTKIYKKVLKRLETEEINITMEQGTIGEGITIRDIVETEKKKKQELEASLQKHEKPEESPAKTALEANGSSSSQSNGKGLPATPKSKKKVFPFKVKKAK